MSFGGGMCNICLAYLGLPVLTVATTRAGDYIDHSAASVTGETPTTVRLHKENAVENVFALDSAEGGAIDRAAAMVESKKLPRFTGPIPIACGWGTAMAGNFLANLRTAISRTKLPVAISEVTIAKDPLNATAKGALVGAMLNM